MVLPRRTLARAGAVAASALLLAVPLSAHLSGASSHREAPLIAQDPTADGTDVFAFVSPDAPNTVTLIANWIPFEEPGGGPNFYHFSDTARYRINVDNDGDAIPDVIYQWEFETAIQNVNTFLYNTGPITSINDPDYNYRQRYTVTKFTDGGPVDGTDIFSDKLMPPDNIGPRSTPDYESLAAAGVYTSGSTKTFAGQREDPFYVDVQSIFDLLGLRPFNKAHVIELKKAKGVDTTGGYNIHTTAIQVPINDLKDSDCTVNASPSSRRGVGANGVSGGGATDTSCVIGVWATAERRTTTTLTPGGMSTSGAWVQVSRLGNPLVNEVVVALAQKDAFNGLRPDQDATTIDLSRVTDPEVARLYCVLYGIASPGLSCNNNTPGTRTAPRDDLVGVFLTGFTIPGALTTQQENSVATPSEQLRLNVAIAPTAGICQGDRLGVVGGDLAGWPNGRRLEDDVTDIALRAVAGGYALTPSFENQSPNNQLGDGVDQNDMPCLAEFPYMGTPHEGYEHGHHDGKGKKKN